MFYFERKQTVSQNSKNESMAFPPCKRKKKCVCVQTYTSLSTVLSCHSPNSTISCSTSVRVVIFFKKEKLLKVYSFAPYQDLTALSQRNLSFFRARGKRPALSDIIIIFNLATLSNGFVGCNGWSGVFVLKPIEWCHVSLLSKENNTKGSWKGQRYGTHRNGRLFVDRFWLIWRRKFIASDSKVYP